MVERLGLAVPSGKAATPTLKPPISLTSATSSSAYVKPPSVAVHGVRPVRRVAAQGEDVADPGRGVRREDRGQLVAGVADAGEVGHRGHRGLARDPAGHPDGRVAGAAAGAVGDRDERRAVRLQGADRAPELLLAGLVLGREELERERPLTLADQVPDTSHAIPSHARSLGFGAARPASVHWLVSSG